MTRSSLLRPVTNTREPSGLIAIASTWSGPPPRSYRATQSSPIARAEPSEGRTAATAPSINATKTIGSRDLIILTPAVSGKRPISPAAAGEIVTTAGEESKPRQPGNQFARIARGEYTSKRGEACPG